MFCFFEFICFYVLERQTRLWFESSSEQRTKV